MPPNRITAILKDERGVRGDRLENFVQHVESVVSQFVP
ncbi:MAG: hypothetical protein ACREQV_07685 [Candidatus Binatia bacterium]